MKILILLQVALLLSFHPVQAKDKCQQTVDSFIKSLQGIHKEVTYLPKPTVYSNMKQLRESTNQALKLEGKVLEKMYGDLAFLLMSLDNLQRYNPENLSRIISDTQGVLSSKLKKKIHSIGRIPNDKELNDLQDVAISILNLAKSKGLALKIKLIKEDKSEKKIALPIDLKWENLKYVKDIEISSPNGNELIDSETVFDARFVRDLIHSNLNLKDKSEKGYLANEGELTIYNFTGSEFKENRAQNEFAKIRDKDAYNNFQLENKRIRALEEIISLTQDSRLGGGLTPEDIEELAELQSKHRKRSVELIKKAYGDREFLVSGNLGKIKKMGVIRNSTGISNLAVQTTDQIQLYNLTYNCRLKLLNGDLNGPYGFNCSSAEFRAEICKYMEPAIKSPVGSKPTSRSESIR